MSDITRRKAVEQALHDMVIRMENIIEGTHVATYEWNVQTGETIFNETWAQFIGYTLDELAPVNIKTWERLTHADDLKRASELLERHFTGQLPYYDCEYRMKHKDGRWIWVHDRGRVFTHTHDGKPLMMFGTHTDITGRKQMEADLLQEKSLLAQKVEERTSDLRLANTELQHAARIKDEFLASMSHELRTPLTGILGLSEAFQMGIYGELNQKQVESIQNIEKSGRHLLTLINDILDLSKIGAGMITLELITVSIREVCLSSLHMVRQVANEKQIKVNLVIEEGVDYLEADARRLKQILVNLLGNAVKFSPVGSDIGLEVKGDVGNQQITFTVWDHGIGIPTRDLSRLFQVFIQLDSALSRQYGGTGLGLSLVLKMVELHGGGVRVESEPGKGSRFIVTFPWQGNPTPKADSVPLQTIGGAEVRKNIGHPIILIVEDNLLYLNLLADILAHSGYRVTKAQNGEEGIARARELKPDLILMDIQMPVLDGLQATRQIRTDPDLQKTPIIALTALAMSGDREKCIEAGMNAYLSKPVNIEELKKEMNTLIHHPSN